MSRRAVRWCLLALWLVSCESDRKRTVVGAAPESFGLGRPASASTPTRASDAAALPARPYQVEAPRPAPAVAAHEGVDLGDSEGGRFADFVVDQLVDVAAAGPASATPKGVLLFNRDDRLWLARFAGLPRAGGPPRATPIEPVPPRAGPFPLARAAAVRGDHAYWVSKGRLLHQPVALAGSGRPPEVLREDARAGTRVATPIGEPRHLRAIPQVAAYVARPRDPEAPSQAKLWLEGQREALTLSPDSSSASSVVLAATATGLLAVSLEARTGMSSLHVRSVDWPSSGQVALGDDQVVWVGGPGRSTTELDLQVSRAPAQPRGRSAPSQSLAVWMPLERDITHFGLLRLDVTLPAEVGRAEESWWLYDNGLEPAPVAVARVCGRRFLAAARPTSPRPGALQELVVGDLGRGDDSPVAIVARSRAFFDLSLSELKRGALLTYVADHRTWARTIRCNSS